MVKIQPDGAINLYTALAFVIADTIALGLRIVSKYTTKKGLRNDDWWICAGLLFFYTWCGLIMYAVAGVGGSLEPILLKNPAEFLEAIKIVWIATFFFPVSITATKISILCFYRSIFAIRPFRIATHCITVLCVLWCIFGLFFIAFQCKPIKAAYDLRLAPTAQCFPYGSFVLGLELSNVILDVAILALPVFVVSTLHLGTRRKMLLASIFLLGGFVIITCVLRIVYSYDPRAPQLVSDFSKALLWTTIETGTAIICACLPTFRPLISQPQLLSTKFKEWYSSFRSTLQSQESETNIISQEPPNTSAVDRSDDDWKRSTEAPLIQARGKTSRFAPNGFGSSYPMNAISVETRVDVV